MTELLHYQILDRIVHGNKYKNKRFSQQDRFYGVFHNEGVFDNELFYPTHQVVVNRYTHQLNIFKDLHRDVFRIFKPPVDCNQLDQINYDEHTSVPYMFKNLTANVIQQVHESFSEMTSNDEQTLEQTTPDGPCHCAQNPNASYSTLGMSSLYIQPQKNNSLNEEGIWLNYFKHQASDRMGTESAYGRAYSNVLKLPYSKYNAQIISENENRDSQKGIVSSDFVLKLLNMTPPVQTQLLNPTQVFESQSDNAQFTSRDTLSENYASVPIIYKQAPLGIGAFDQTPAYMILFNLLRDMTSHCKSFMRFHNQTHHLFMSEHLGSYPSNMSGEYQIRMNLISNILDTLKQIFQTYHDIKSNARSDPTDEMFWFQWPLLECLSDSFYNVFCGLPKLKQESMESMSIATLLDGDVNMVLDSTLYDVDDQMTLRNDKDRIMLSVLAQYLIKNIVQHQSSQLYRYFKNLKYLVDQFERKYQPTSSKRKMIVKDMRLDLNVPDNVNFMNDLYRIEHYRLLLIVQRLWMWSFHLHDHLYRYVSIMIGDINISENLLDLIAGWHVTQFANYNIIPTFTKLIDVQFKMPYLMDVNSHAPTVLLLMEKQDVSLSKFLIDDKNPKVDLSKRQFVSPFNVHLDKLGSKQDKEKLRIMRDNVMESIVFQVCYTLCAGQSLCGFTHNDAHFDNWMLRFASPNQKYQRYRIILRNFNFNTNDDYYVDVLLNTEQWHLKYIDFGMSSYIMQDIDMRYQNLNHDNVAIENPLDGYFMTKGWKKGIIMQNMNHQQNVHDYINEKSHKNKSSSYVAEMMEPDLLIRPELQISERNKALEQEDVVAYRSPYIDYYRFIKIWNEDLNEQRTVNGIVFDPTRKRVSSHVQDWLKNVFPHIAGNQYHTQFIHASYYNMLLHHPQNVVDKNYDYDVFTKFIEHVLPRMVMKNKSSPIQQKSVSEENIYTVIIDQLSPMMGYRRPKNYVMSFNVHKNVFKRQSRTESDKMFLMSAYNRTNSTSQANQIQVLLKNLNNIPTIASSYKNDMIRYKNNMYQKNIQYDNLETSMVNAPGFINKVYGIQRAHNSKKPQVPQMIDYGRVPPMINEP